ncbi:hypothetical protein ACFE04_012553 [Oxalis oulophora]
MRPPSLHSNFFSSLKQVEKRLKLEHPQISTDVPNPSPKDAEPLKPTFNEKNYSLTESLSSPICVYTCTNSDISSNPQESSELPLEFLTCSPHTHRSQPEKGHPLQDIDTGQNIETNGVDDIEQLIQMLGLSDICEDSPEDSDFCATCGDKCECEFYEKIVGVKGPKCEREVKRMDGWIKHYLGNGYRDEKMEPLRLAFLLLGKAAFGDCGFEGIEFPSSIQEFLKIDPPKD